MQLYPIVRRCIALYDTVRLFLVTPMNCWRNSNPFWCKASLCTIKIGNFSTYHIARAYSTLVVPVFLFYLSSIFFSHNEQSHNVSVLCTNNLVMSMSYLDKFNKLNVLRQTTLELSVSDQSEVYILNKLVGSNVLRIMTLRKCTPMPWKKS